MGEQVAQWFYEVFFHFCRRHKVRLHWHLDYECFRYWVCSDCEQESNAKYLADKAVNDAACGCDRLTLRAAPQKERKP